MEIQKNKDFIEGIGMLKKNASHLGLGAYIRIASCQWIIALSSLLSEYGCCYRFWKNVIDQEKTSLIPYCKSIDDLFYGPTHLFQWVMTKEGYDYWIDMRNKLYKRYPLKGLTKLNKL